MAETSTRAMKALSNDQLRAVIAREIWAYNECPWPFDEPPEGMAQLQKQIAIDQAERIRKAVMDAVLAEEDETYEIGKRDGYESAVQNLDLATGGDGEFKGGTIPGGTVDVPTMKARIVERFTSQSTERDRALEEAAQWHAEQENNNRTAMKAADAKGRGADHIAAMYRYIAQTHANSAAAIRAMKTSAAAHTRSNAADMEG